MPGRRTARYLTTMTGFALGNPEVAVIDAATGARHNISVNGFADTAPQFSRDGAMLYWQSDRFSMRQLDSQTATVDVVGAFLSREGAAFAAGRAGGGRSARFRRSAGPQHAPDADDPDPSPSWT